jgi:hypothetical protein
MRMDDGTDRSAGKAQRHEYGPYLPPGIGARPSDE